MVVRGARAPSREQEQERTAAAEHQQLRRLRHLRIALIDLIESGGVAGSLALEEEVLLDIRLGLRREIDLVDGSRRKLPGELVVHIDPHLTEAGRPTGDRQELVE